MKIFFKLKKLEQFLIEIEKKSLFYHPNNTYQDKYK